MGWHGALCALFVIAQCNSKRKKEIAREQWSFVAAKDHN
jgi:hypothetical protein